MNSGDTSALSSPSFPSVMATAASAASPDWMAIVREKVETLRFGVVQLVVHDGRVTQIERTEKTRLISGRDST